MEFDDYVKDEFRKHEKLHDKLEHDLNDIKLHLHKIQIALEVDKQLRASTTKRNALISGGIISFIVSMASNIFKGFF